MSNNTFMWEVFQVNIPNVLFPETENEKRTFIFQANATVSTALALTPSLRKNCLYFVKTIFVFKRKLLMLWVFSNYFYKCCVVAIRTIWFKVIASLAGKQRANFPLCSHTHMWELVFYRLGAGHMAITRSPIKEPTLPGVARTKSPESQPQSPAHCLNVSNCRQGIWHHGIHAQISACSGSYLKGYFKDTFPPGPVFREWSPRFITSNFSRPGPCN